MMLRSISFIGLVGRVSKSGKRLGGSAMSTMYEDGFSGTVGFSKGGDVRMMKGRSVAGGSVWVRREDLRGLCSNSIVVQVCGLLRRMTTTRTTRGQGSVRS
jgi:hypothetical protein